MIDPFQNLDDHSETHEDDECIAEDGLGEGGISPFNGVLSFFNYFGGNKNTPYMDDDDDDFR